MPISVKRYYSGMPGAPSLTGVAGSLISLLNAVLIDGFNAKSISSASQSGGVATVTTSAAHMYQPQDVIVISGANESVWNDEFRITSVSATDFTFAINATAPIPTGTLSVKIAPLGWSKPFSGTNKACYLPKAQYTQCYLRVLDDATTPAAANGRWAKWRGYETMSDIDTGTGLFPTVAQSTNGLSCFKSSTADSTARAWWLAGDGGIFYFGSTWANSYTTPSSYCFGDPNSLRAGDAYSTLICAAEAPSDGIISYPGQYHNFPSLGTRLQTQGGKYLARSYNQIGSAVAAGMMGDQGVSSSLGQEGLPYPHPVDNGLLFAPVALVDNSVIRSRALPGLYQPLHVAPLAHLDLLADLPDFSARTFQAFDLAYGTSTRAQCLIDITGPWR